MASKKSKKGEQKQKRQKKGAGEATYRDASRRLAASFVFVAPMFALYQLALALDPSVRNGTAPLFDELFHEVSNLGFVFANLLLLGLLILAIWRTRSRRLHRPGLYGFMFLESCLWACAMLLVAQFLVPQILFVFEYAFPELARRLIASAGAGIYEEFLFRFLLMGGLILVFRRGLDGHPAWVVPLAILASALLFSWAHHAIGQEPYERKVFWYRAIMGVILGGIFWWRGLGIVIYAHALYNVVLVTLEHVRA